jgi:hypothetical protein
VSIKEGKIKADAEIAESLHKRAKGYKYEEVTKECGVVTKTVTKEVSPDTGAAMAWLKNRRGTQWRDKQDIESININTNNNTNKNFDMSTPIEDIQAEIDRLQAELSKNGNGK